MVFKCTYTQIHTSFMNISMNIKNVWLLPYQQQKELFYLSNMVAVEISAKIISFMIPFHCHVNHNIRISRNLNYFQSEIAIPFMVCVGRKISAIQCGYNQWCKIVSRLVWLGPINFDIVSSTIESNESSNHLNIMFLYRKFGISKRFLFRI